MAFRLVRFAQPINGMSGQSRIFLRELQTSAVIEKTKATPNTADSGNSTQCATSTPHA